MSKLVELQKKYPHAKYEPLADCPKCKGEGVWWHEVEPTEENGRLESGFRCCMCIFVAPENLDIARSALKSGLERIVNGTKT